MRSVGWIDKTVKKKHFKSRREIEREGYLFVCLVDLFPSQLEVTFNFMSMKILWRYVF